MIGIQTWIVQLEGSRRIGIDFDRPLRFGHTGLVKPQRETSGPGKDVQGPQRSADGAKVACI